MNKRIILSVFCFISFLSITASPDAEELISSLDTAGPENKVDILNAICWKLRNSDAEHALDYGLRAIKLADSLKYEKGLMKAYSFTGVVFRNIGNYTDALDYYYKGLDLALKLNNPEQQGYAFINIANLHVYQEQPDEALKFLKKAVPCAGKINNKTMQAYIFLNFGRVYIMKEQYDSALVNVERALAIRKKIDDKNGQSVCYKYTGDIYQAVHKYNLAIKNYITAQESFDLKHDKDLLADLLNNLAMCYFHTSRLNQAEDNALKSLRIAEEIHSKYRIKNAYETLAEIYRQKGEYKAVSGFLENVIRYKDSLYNDEFQKQLKIFDYSLEKRDQENKITLLNKDRKLQQTFLIGIGTVTFLGLVLLFVLFRSNTQRKKANKLLTAQKEEIQEKNFELNQINDKLAEQHDNLEKLYNKLTATNVELNAKSQLITDSIHYARRIQHAILPPAEFISEILPQHFILFKPRDIVSGDFYWIKTIKNHIIIATADCTGHGVPGAFMSMLGIAFLNEIVTRTRFDKANEILDRLRKKVKTSLRQTGKTFEPKDGMDMSLCIIDTEYLEMQFAGAFNPVHIIKNNKLETIKADRQPIAIYPMEKEFTNHTVKLSKNDMIYTFSDGYVDQTGGDKGKKLLPKNFRKILLDIHQLPMNEQKQVLEDRLEAWRRDHEQVDDILIIGIRL